ncbi:MAG: permease-like cell division protein FtsX [Acidimicrobiales bacterium]
MALRIDYLAKETGNNLVRNPTLTVATVLTVAVSLALLGASLLIQRGVDHFNTRYKDDVEFIVWMTADAPQENVDAVKSFLDDSLVVRSSSYVNHEATFAEFQTYYADQPEVLDLVDPNDLPTSFRVVPEVPDLALIRSLGQEIEALPGVSQVSYAEEYIKQLNDMTNSASRVMIVAAVLSAVASGLLMYNTIRTGLFARRREIEVMRLVGATKWFIRIPFMLEGLLQGLIGAVFSGIAVFGLNKLIASSVNGRENLKLFSSFALDNSQVAVVAVILLLVGAALGSLGAGIAVTRYLDA